MDDLISRRKAFEYFVTLWECIGTIMDRDEWEDVCMTTANEIPSAQPKKRTEKRTETHACDLIDRQAAIDIAVFECGKWIGLAKEISKQLKQLPSAQPQYEELTPEEAASEIASRSTMSAYYWLDDMIRLKQMGYVICRKR